MPIPFIAPDPEVRAYRARLKEESNSRLAKDFGVAAEHEQSFAKTRSRLRSAGELVAVGAGASVAFLTASALPSVLVLGSFVAAVAAVTNVSRMAVDRFLPRFFQK